MWFIKRNASKIPNYDFKGKFWNLYLDLAALRGNRVLVYEAKRNYEQLEY